MSLRQNGGFHDTDLAVMDVVPEGLKIVELAPGVTREFVQSKTGVTLL